MSLPTSVGSEEVPDPQDPNTFCGSRGCAGASLTSPATPTCSGGIGLFQLRRRLPEVTDSRLECVKTTFDELSGWLLIQRPHLIMAVNLGKASAEVGVPALGTLLAASDETSAYWAQPFISLPIALL